MKNKSQLHVRTLFISLLILFFSSCHNWFDDDDPETKNDYLVNYEIYQTLPYMILEQVFNEMVDENPEMVFMQERIQHGIIICKISYNTTFQGEKIVASGLVSLPTGEGTFPVISFQNGTNTEHDKAPSVNPENTLFRMLESVASTGFVISIPDYLGFGVSSDDTFHPYLHKESTVQSVLDMLRAVKELAANELDVSLSNELYITGYSQGGWATMQVQKAIEEQHSNEFHLKASACGAGPYDLSSINEYILNQTTYPMPYFIGYMFNSYMKLNDMTTPIDSVFKEPYASKIPTLYDGSKSGNEINAELTTSVAGLFTENYRESYQTDTTFNSLRATLDENSIGAWPTTTPTMILHGTEDDFVPFQVSENIYNDFQSTGIPANRVTLERLEGMDHRSGIIPSGLASIGWFLALTE